MTGNRGEGGEGSSGPDFVGHHDPRPKTVLQTKTWATIVHGIGRREPVGAREGGR